MQQFDIHGRLVTLHKIPQNIHFNHIKEVMLMSKHQGQPPIDPHGAGWPSTTGRKSGSGRGGNPPKGK